MKVVVGCPVTNRAWVLPQWFDYVDQAFLLAGIHPTFEFVLGTSVDDTEEVLRREVSFREGNITYETEEPEDGLARNWNVNRYLQMAHVRNLLLERVRLQNPDYFLSIDSDILLHPQALTNMLETIQEFDAVASKVYLAHPPGRTVNYANLTRHSNALRRADGSGVFKVHVIMALKLMSRAAYTIDYRPNFHGEDIGWSVHARANGLVLGWDGRTASKHVMSEKMLHKEDKRVGY